MKLTKKHKLKPKENFLKDIEECIENSTDKDIMKERLEFVKTSLLERVNQTAMEKKSRRTMSVSSLSSVGVEGRKRHSSEAENGGSGSDRLQVRHKPSSSPAN